MSGTIGDDDLIGTEGHDTIALLAGNDTYQGLGGNDFIEGDAGNDSLLGGNGADWLDGGADADTLLGGDGDDTLKAGIGLDYLFGGAGNDIADFSGFGSVTVNLENAADTYVVSAGGVITRFAGIEKIRTDGGILSLQEDGGAFTVMGGNDNDYILSGGGNDCLLGGAGDDFLGGGAGDDTLAGEDGSDIISGGGGSDRLYGGSAPGIAPSGQAFAPAPIVSIGPGEPSLISNAENLSGIPGDGFIVLAVITGTSDPDTLNGTDDADSINGLGGGDLISANNGNDTVISYANSTIFGAGGNDLFLSRPFTPGDSNDLLVRDDLTGAMLDGGDNGTDELDRPWQDTYLLTRLAAQFGVTLPFVNIERLAIRPPASTFLAYGTASADYYDFYGRSISIVDYSTGNLAFLELRAGDGSDVVFAPSQSKGNSIYGGNDRDFLYGYGAQDSLYGEEGNDFLDGGANNDELYGGNGSDCMIGGLGADTFFGGTADDVFVVLADDAGVPAELMAEAVDGVLADGSLDMVFEEIGEGSDTILASVSYTLPPARMPGPFLNSFFYSEVEALVLTGTANINGTGNAFAQLVQGNSGNNSLDGGGGADTLVGDAGHDTLRGGTGTISGISINDNDSLLGGAGDDWLMSDIGNDTMDGGIGNDWASYAAASNGVTIDLANGSAQGGHGTDRLINIEAALGGTGNDSLLGNAADNTLSGGAGGYDVIDAGDGMGDLVYFQGSAISISFFSVGTTTSATVTRGASDLGSVARAEIFQGTGGNDFAQIFSTGTNSPLFFDGAGGNDTIQSDTNARFFFADYRSGSAAHGVTVDLALGIARDRHGGTDSLSGVLNVAGSYQADSLLGDDNNNILRPFDGLDAINGGNGTDMVDYTDAAGAVSVNLAIGRGFNAAGGDADTLISIENARGGDGADTLLGSSGDNLLAGAGGSDSLAGGAGNDTVDYSSALAEVTVNLASARAQDGLGGTDSLSGFEAALGSGFNDSLLGAAAAESLFGDSGDDTIQGAGGHDWLDGGNGNDSLAGGEGNDTFFAAAGSGGYGGGFIPPGQASPADTMRGGEGDDHFIVSSSTTLVIDGGTGNDTIEWAGSFGPVMLTFYADGADGSENDALSFMQPLPGLFDNVTGIEALRITTSSPSITLSASVIQAMSDTDSLAIYGSGTITFTDEGWFQGPNIGSMLTFTNGAVTVTASSALTVIGSAAGPTESNDSMVGNASSNQLFGLGGNDTLNGLEGNDTLNGGIGADCLDGGNGNDFFYVDNALDLVLEAGGGGSDTVSTSVSFTMPNHVEQIMIAAGVTGITITGSSGADIIIGNGLANNFNGGAGDDIILAQNITVQDILALFAFP